MITLKSHIKCLKLFGYAAFGVAALNGILAGIDQHGFSASVGYSDAVTIFTGVVSLIVADALQKLEAHLNDMDAGTTPRAKTLEDVGDRN